MILQCSYHGSFEIHRTNKDKKWEWYELTEFDKELIHDPHQVAIYVAEIFHYLKEREVSVRQS